MPDKRKRRTKEQIAAEKASKSAEKAARPPIDRAAILEKARAVAAANRVARGDEPRPKKAKADGSPRRSKEQIAAEKAAKAAARAARGPIDRAEQMAKARAARMANLAAAGYVPKTKKPKTGPARIRRSKEQIEADNARLAAERAARGPINRVELMAKARAVAAANRAARGIEPKPKKEKTGPTRIRRTKEQIAADNARKAAERAARGPIDRVALMAKARAVAAANRLARGVEPKPKKEKKAGPPIDRVAQMAKARAARMAKLAANPKPEKKKRISADGSKRQGMSPEHMAKIRAMRGKKKD